MTRRRDIDDLHTFEALRPELIALAYRMLGDAAQAQDLVQEAWLRWHNREGEVEVPKAFLITIVTRLCLNELSSARARREEAQGLRLPEPVDLEAAGMGSPKEWDRISMAFLVLLERLSPPERAVLLLHEVFDYSHDEISKHISRSPSACRKLLERARTKIASGRKVLSATREEHQQLLEAFMSSVLSGDLAGVLDLLAADATLLTNAGSGGANRGKVRNVERQLTGASRIAAFAVAGAKSRLSQVTFEQRDLNGRPALLFIRNGVTFGALLLEVFEGKIQSLYFQANPERLRFLGKGSTHSA